MRKLTFICVLTSLILFSACENRDWEFDDYDYTTVYFAYQYPVRTLVLGNDETFDNTLDNQHKCEIQATMGGVYENNVDRIIDYVVDNSLCDGLYFTNGGKIESMPANYYELSSNQLVIPKGDISGGVEVHLTDAFFADPKSVENTYVIPLVMTDVQNADSILVGTSAVDNPNLVVSSDWSIQPKNFILYAVKYINPWDGVYLRRGVDRITTGGSTTTAVRHEYYVEDDEVVEFTTRSLQQAAWALSVGGQTCNVLLTFDADNRCTLSTDTPNCSVSGTGEYIEKGEKNSFNGKDRDVIHLDYTVELNGTTYVTQDTLVMRDRQVKGEWFTVTKQ